MQLDKSTINQNVEGIYVVHDDIDADDPELDVGDDSQTRRIREELVDHEIERLENPGVCDERPVASMKASSTSTTARRITAIDLFPTIEVIK